MLPARADAEFHEAVLRILKCKWNKVASDGASCGHMDVGKEAGSHILFGLRCDTTGLVCHGPFERCIVGGYFRLNIDHLDVWCTRKAILA